MTLRTVAEDLVGPDLALQLSRRVDWRFLLPDPALGDVGVVGIADHELWQSLETFSVNLAKLNLSAAGSDPGGRFDLVVVVEPTVPKLSKAAKALRKGGFAYIEGHGLTALPGRVKSLWRKKEGSIVPNTPAGVARACRRVGLQQTEVYWVWPDFRRSNRFIPMPGRGPLRFVLQTEGKSAKARLKSLLRDSRFFARLLPWLVPNFSVLCRREGP